MDIIHRLTIVLDHHRYSVLGIALGVAMSAYLLGCAVQTTSTRDPAQQVTADQLGQEVIEANATFERRAADLRHLHQQLNLEITAYNQTLHASEAELHRKIAERHAVLEILGGLATTAATGTLSPGAAVGSLVTLLGVGASLGFGADTLRKNKVIDELKAGASA